MSLDFRIKFILRYNKVLELIEGDFRSLNLRVRWLHWRSNISQVKSVTKFYANKNDFLRHIEVVSITMLIKTNHLTFLIEKKVKSDLFGWAHQYGSTDLQIYTAKAWAFDWNSFDILFFHRFCAEGRILHFSGLISRFGKFQRVK